jgi:ribose 5-phosphate isomerase B
VQCCRRSAGSHSFCFARNHCLPATPTDQVKPSCAPAENLHLTPSGYMPGSPMRSSPTDFDAPLRQAADLIPTKGSISLSTTPHPRHGTCTASGSRSHIQTGITGAPAQKAKDGMRIAIASDHAGVDLKENVAVFLRDLGHEVINLGTDDIQPVDYPDYAEKVGVAVREGSADRGIVICGSGVGASVAANKIPGIRAGLCHDSYSAHQGVEHDDMNVLVLGARVIGVEMARELARAYVGASFTGAERHRRRLAKVSALEKRYSMSKDDEL